MKRTPQAGVAEGLVADVSAVLEPVFVRLSRIAALVAEARPEPGRPWPESRLEALPALAGELLAEDDLAVGWGFVAVPGLIEGQDRFMSWWQRSGAGVRRLRLNFDPSSIDVYDYLQMAWFQQPQQGGSRAAFGPYVDYSGSELYIVTATVPVIARGEFIGVAGADLTGELERRLVSVLRTARAEAVVLNDEFRVVAANTPRRVFGSRLVLSPEPETGLEPGLEAGRGSGGETGSEAPVQTRRTPDGALLRLDTLPVGTGWMLARAEPLDN